MDLVEQLRQDIQDQDELDWLCGPDAPLPRPVDAPPMTARELVTSPQPVPASHGVRTPPAQGRRDVTLRTSTMDDPWASGPGIRDQPNGQSPAPKV